MSAAPGAGLARDWTAQRPRPGRIAAYLLLALLGAVVGIAGSLVQAAWFPAGLLLALLGSAGLFCGARIALGNQLGVAAAGAGWLVAIVVLSVGRPEGDALFGAGVGPLLFILGGMVIAVMCATLGGLSQPGGGPGRPDK
ncbi:DUF6113 family protein [Streptomyces qinzhouensis]|uniref:Integral membrane protein n=1 Tax=Streptomyces qinzhouensis TaxID=2599401 RepID=A0A5B8JBR9_9ACTN|nr:DUF6113 family protein [Streptomyces qinzhouensis]QDY78867.1 hypothetical protein FQU76_22740 [Streptomyces qinzhouensis]